MAKPEDRETWRKEVEACIRRWICHAKDDDDNNDYGLAVQNVRTFQNNSHVRDAQPEVNLQLALLFL